MNFVKSVSTLLALVSVAAAGIPFQARLTADVADVDVSFGLVLNHANTIEANSAFHPPPGDYTAGTMVIAMLASQEKLGTYEVYTTNSSGNIPYMAETEAVLYGRKDNNSTDDRLSAAPTFGAGPGMCVYRWTTTDFKTYQGGNNCLVWVSKNGLSDIKTFTRDEDTGTYYMLYWAVHGVAELYTSTNHGMKWKGPQSVSGITKFSSGNFHAKDDINFLWQKGFGLVNMQVFWERNLPNTPGGMCDNGGCNSRRVIGSMESSSASGTKWKFSGSLRVPSAKENDPPELQFYRIRPFVVPGTGGERTFAHVLLYAPSPPIHGSKKYGRQPSMCQPDSPVKNCHGPHMYEEWWTLKRGASPTDLSLSAWRRPARFTKMAPENAYLFAQPGLVGAGGERQMIWIGSGTAYTLPLHRGVGLYAPANARVKIQPALDLSRATEATTLWLNADAKWGPKLPQGGCDETCAAYIMVELEDHTGKVIKGYDHDSFDAIMDEDGVNLALTWHGSTKLPVGQKGVTVKVWFRAAKVYALYLGDRFQP